jgi:hypothetical protein
VRRQPLAPQCFHIHTVSPLHTHLRVGGRATLAGRAGHGNSQLGGHQATTSRPARPPLSGPYIEGMLGEARSGSGRHGLRRPGPRTAWSDENVERTTLRQRRRRVDGRISRQVGAGGRGAAARAELSALCAVKSERRGSEPDAIRVLGSRRRPNLAPWLRRDLSPRISRSLAGDGRSGCWAHPGRTIRPIEPWPCPAAASILAALYCHRAVLEREHSHSFAHPHTPTPSLAPASAPPAPGSPTPSARPDSAAPRCREALAGHCFGASRRPRR